MKTELHFQGGPLDGRVIETTSIPARWSYSHSARGAYVPQWITWKEDGPTTIESVTMRQV